MGLHYGSIVRNATCCTFKVGTMRAFKVEMGEPDKLHSHWGPFLAIYLDLLSQLIDEGAVNAWLQVLVVESDCLFPSQYVSFHRVHPARKSSVKVGEILSVPNLGPFVFPLALSVEPVVARHGLPSRRVESCHVQSLQRFDECTLRNKLLLLNSRGSKINVTSQVPLFIYRDIV